MLIAKFGNSSKEYPIEFIYHSANVVELLGYVGSNKSGFNLYSIDGAHIGDYSDFKTVYRNQEKSTWFSNDGSHYIPPKKDVTVVIIWNDSENPEHRPESVDVSVVVNGSLFDTQTLDEECEWKHTYEQVSADDKYEIACPEYEYYTLIISGTTATYIYTEPQPSIEERGTAVEGRLDTDEEVLTETFSTVDSIVTEIIPEIVGI